MIQIPSTVSAVTKSTVIKHGMPFKATPTPRYKHLGTQQYYALFVNRARRLRLAVEALQDIPAIYALFGWRRGVVVSGVRHERS